MGLKEQIQTCLEHAHTNTLSEKAKGVNVKENVKAKHLSIMFLLNILKMHFCIRKMKTENRTSGFFFP